MRIITGKTIISIGKYYQIHVRSIPNGWEIVIEGSGQVCYESMIMPVDGVYSIGEDFREQSRVRQAIMDFLRDATIKDSGQDVRLDKFLEKIRKDYVQKKDEANKA